MKLSLLATGLVFVLVGCASETADDVGEAAQADITVSGDKTDPARARGDRNAGSTTLFNRKFVLHISDSEGLAWASIDDGNPKDEVWLDRSFDGGSKWEKLGTTKIPDGGRGWRTLMFGIDSRQDHRIGAVRACGKASDRSEVTCTPWARMPAKTPLDGAATGMMQLYDFGDGLWQDAWWNSANALTAIIDYSAATGNQDYRYAIGRTFDENKRHNIIETDFRNEFMDDTAWWGLAWIRAFDLTGERRYLDMARIDGDYLWSFKDDICGGGVWWKKDRKYKNAITNELFIKLAAALHNRMPGDTVWRDRAQQTWTWFKASGMINGEKMINDGLDNCRNNGQETWTYNQGVILGALVELSKATNQPALLDEAKALAEASTRNARLNPNGILREPCEDSADACGADGPSFKGAYMRNLGELDRALAGRPFRAYLQTQATALTTKARNNMDQYGLKWAGPFDRAEMRRQHSALDALTAAR